MRMMRLWNGGEVMIEGSEKWKMDILRIDLYRDKSDMFLQIVCCLDFL